jgi:hypothetical protein
VNKLERIFTLGVGAWLCCACSKPGGSEPKAEPAGEAKPAGDPSPTLAGVAYLAVDGVGVHVLDAQGWRLHHASRSNIADMLALDGQLHVLSAFGVQRVGDDGQATTLAELGREDFATLGSLETLGSADGREFWVAGREGVGHFTGSWALTPLAEIGPAEANSPVDPTVDLAVDHAHTPWLIHAGVFVHREGKWVGVDTPPLSFSAHPLAVAADARAKTVVIHAGCDAEGQHCAVLRDREGSVTRYELDAGGCPELDRLALSPNAKLAVIAGRCGLIRVNLDEPGGAPTRVELDAGWPGQPLRSLAIDDSGRVWAGTNNGLTLVGPDDALGDYPLAALGDISGPLTAIVVRGEGPPPPTLGRVRHGGLSATIVTLEQGRKQPVAGAKVELCNKLPPPAPGAPDPTRSPCAGVEGVHATTTDAQGRLRVDNVPIDHYYIGVELDGRWIRGVPKAMSMRAGMQGNIGSVVVERPE